MKDNQQCEKMIDTYLMLDKHERIPLAVCVHLLTCKKCRTQVRMMTQAEEKLSSPSLNAYNADPSLHLHTKLVPSPFYGL